MENGDNQSIPSSRSYCTEVLDNYCRRGSGCAKLVSSRLDSTLCDYLVIGLLFVVFTVAIDEKNYHVKFFS